jgi:hypothetical protein
VRDFYTTTTKQIFDIHDEARRIADGHKASRQVPTTGSASADSTEIPASDTSDPSNKEAESAPHNSLYLS